MILFAVAGAMNGPTRRQGNRLQVGEQTLMVIAWQRCKNVVLPGRLSCGCRATPLREREKRVHSRSTRSLCQRRSHHSPPENDK